MTPTPPFQTPLLCPSVIVKAYAPRVNKFSPLFRGGERESVYAISTSPSGRFDARFMEIKKLRVARGRSRLPIQPPRRALLSSKEFPGSLFPKGLLQGEKDVWRGGSERLENFHGFRTFEKPPPLERTIPRFEGFNLMTGG